ncbi:MAG: hypothetical protein K2K00_00370, partial [Muribaculaceae bacterium]|nr:hypothetical protein [Muribaculaceae bacterium]
DAEIQSIKDLCSAQQQLGAIGDEVQLAGAQKLATFLSEKNSLAALIPVMRYSNFTDNYILILILILIAWNKKMWNKDFVICVFLAYFAC